MDRKNTEQKDKFLDFEIMSRFWQIIMITVLAPWFLTGRATWLNKKNCSYEFQWLRKISRAESQKYKNSNAITQTVEESWWCPLAGEKKKNQHWVGIKGEIAAKFHDDLDAEKFQYMRGIRDWCWAFPC